MKYLTSEQATSVMIELDHALISTNAELAMTSGETYRAILVARHKSISAAIGIMKAAKSVATTDASDDYLPAPIAMHAPAGADGDKFPVWHRGQVLGAIRAAVLAEREGDALTAAIAPLDCSECEGRGFTYLGEGTPGNGFDVAPEPPEQECCQSCVGNGKEAAAAPVVTVAAQPDSASAVVAAAIKWWEGCRPVGWSQAAHIERPAVNTMTSNGTVLGNAIGAYLKASPSLEAQPAGEVERDAKRWRQMLLYVGADQSPAMGVQYFVFRGIHAKPGVNLMRGSVAEHFTDVIDAAMAQGEKQ